MVRRREPKGEEAGSSGQEQLLEEVKTLRKQVEELKREAV